MTMTSDEIKRRALALSEKTNSDTITPTEVGGIMYDTVGYMEDVERNGASLGIRKTYATVSAMEADLNPVGDDGSPLKKGMLVNIYDQDTPDSPDNGKVFSFQEPGWAFRTKIDAGYATKEELSELESRIGEGGNIIIEWNTDVATTRKQVDINKRKAGIQISYFKPTNGWVNEQYIGTDFDDANWENNINWEKIAKQSQVDELEKCLTITSDIETTITAGYAIVADQNNGSYGKGGESSMFSYSDYIPCNGYDYIELTFPIIPSQSTYGLVFYNENKEPIKGDGYSMQFNKGESYGIEIIKILIPKDAYYMRTSYYADSTSYGNFMATIYKKGNIEKIEDSINKSIIINEIDKEIKGITVGYGICADISSISFGYKISNELLSVSDYIQCNNYTLLKVNMPVLIDNSKKIGLCFYNKDKKAISGYVYKEGVEYGIIEVNIKIPNDAMYFTTSIFNSEDYGKFIYSLTNYNTNELYDIITDVYSVSYNDLSENITFTDGYAINANKDDVNFGQAIVSGGISVSDYIPIPEKTDNIQISVFTSINESNNGCVLYDNEKKPIKGYRHQYRKVKKTFIKNIYNIPNNAVYIRTSIIKEDKDNFVVRFNVSNGGKIGNIDNYINHIYNAKNYGAKNNEDIKFILYAMLEDITNDIGYGIIYVPQGIYRLESSVNWKSNIDLIGDGIERTVFLPIGGITAFTGDNISNFKFENFTIDGVNQTGTPPLIKGIYQQYVENAIYRNIEIKNTLATGLGTDFFKNGIIENVRCYNCGRGGLIDPSNASGCSGIGIGTGGWKRENETLTISNCHCNNCTQYGLFIEQQNQFDGDIPTGVSIIGCTAEGNRNGFGVSGCDSVVFVGCTAYNNHHAGFAYDGGTMNSGSTGKRPKFIGCIASNNGKNIPSEYPEYLGQENGFGWYILQNYQGIELISCNSIKNLKSGIEIVNGITGMNIDGGEISENGEHGIDINGNISNFRISPTLIKSNIEDGIRINGQLNKGFIKNISITGNKNGINKTEIGNLGDAIIDENFVYSNTTSDSNIVE